MAPRFFGSWASMKRPRPGENRSVGVQYMWQSLGISRNNHGDGEGTRSFSGAREANGVARLSVNVNLQLSYYHYKTIAKQQESITYNASIPGTFVASVYTLGVPSVW